MIEHYFLIDHVKAVNNHFSTKILKVTSDLSVILSLKGFLINIDFFLFYIPP